MVACESDIIEKYSTLLKIISDFGVTRHDVLSAGNATVGPLFLLVVDSAQTVSDLVDENVGGHTDVECARQNLRLWNTF